MAKRFRGLRKEFSDDDDIEYVMGKIDDDRQQKKDHRAEQRKRNKITLPKLKFMEQECDE